MDDICRERFLNTLWAHNRPEMIKKYKNIYLKADIDAGIVDILQDASELNYYEKMELLFYFGDEDVAFIDGDGSVIPYYPYDGEFDGNVLWDFWQLLVRSDYDE